MHITNLRVWCRVWCLMSDEMCSMSEELNVILTTDAAISQHRYRQELPKAVSRLRPKWSSGGQTRPIIIASSAPLPQRPAPSAERGEREW